MFVFGCAFVLCVSVKVWTTPGPEVNPVAGGFAIYGFFAIWLTVVWRAMRTGLYTNEASVRIRWIHRTRTVAWSRITSVDVEPARYFDMPTRRPAVWFTLDDGERIETPVQRRTPWRMLELAKNVGPILDGPDFDLLVVRLRERL